jgi:hypothetical protein
VIFSSEPRRRVPEEAYVFSTAYHTEIQKPGVIPPFLSLRFLSVPGGGVLFGYKPEEFMLRKLPIIAPD